MTGPIQVPPIPNVRPVFYGTANSGQERLQQSFQALLAVLQGQQEMARQKALQAQQDAGGELLGKYLGDLGQQNVAAVQMPGTAETPGFMVQPFIAKGPLAAFQGKPGRTVYEALKVGSNLLAPEVARISRAREKTDAWTSGEVDIRPVGPNRQLFSFNKRTGKVTPFIKPDGTPATEPETQGPQGSVIPLVDEETGRVFGWNPTTRVTVAAPAGLTKAGAITENERRQAGLYLPASKAFKELDKRGFGNLSFDQAVLVFKALRGDTGAIKEATVRALLTPENRLLVSLYSELIGDIAYGKSGAQINEREFANQRQLIPFLDDGQGRAVKRDVLLENLTGMYGAGFRQLQQNGRRGIKFTPIEDLTGKPYSPMPALSPDEADLLNEHP